MRQGRDGSSCPQILQNHLEERLLDQAQARASYTPFFWGHSRSIPQGMILDAQPLVKSLFCPIRPSPNGFFERGGGGAGGVGGGQKFLLKRLQAVGKHGRHQTFGGPMVKQPTQGLWSAVRILVHLLLAPPAAARTALGRGLNRRPKERRSAALPLGHCLDCGAKPPRCLGPHLPLTKNPNCVYLSDCLPACWLRD